MNDTYNYDETYDLDTDIPDAGDIPGGRYLAMVKDIRAHMPEPQPGKLQLPGGWWDFTLAEGEYEGAPGPSLYTTFPVSRELAAQDPGLKRKAFMFKRAMKELGITHGTMRQMIDAARGRLCYINVIRDPVYGAKVKSITAAEETAIPKKEEAILDI